MPSWEKMEARAERTQKMECLIQALNEYLEARREYDKGRDAYDGYSWDYHGYSFIERCNERAHDFADRLDAYIDERVAIALAKAPDAA